jgi:hypothetical protein
MTVDTNIDEEVLLFHDFEFETPCESTDGCDNTAEWRLVRKCCGWVSLLCDPCKVADENWLDAWGMLGGVDCTECGTHFEVASPGDVYLTRERI